MPAERHTTALLLVLATLLPLACSAAPPDVCVIAPRLGIRDDGDAEGMLPAPDPALVIAEPLQEIRILSNGQLRWRRSATNAAPLPQWMAWPLPPLKGGESLTLLLRPLGQPKGHFARINLRAADAEALSRQRQLIRKLGSDPQLWLAAIDQQLLSGHADLAWALLFAPQAPRGGELDTLRTQVMEQGCGD